MISCGLTFDLRQPRQRGAWAVRSMIDEGVARPKYHAVTVPSTKVLGLITPVRANKLGKFSEAGQSLAPPLLLPCIGTIAKCSQAKEGEAMGRDGQCDDCASGFPKERLEDPKSSGSLLFYVVTGPIWDALCAAE